MGNEILFSESQKFRQWWLWLILFGINGLFLFGIYLQVICGRQFGDHPMSNAGLFAATALTALLTLLFNFFRLDTKITKSGIEVRFFPFHLRYKQFAWDMLAKIYLRQYSPLLEYGGWGLRIGLWGKGNAYNVSGNKGLQLEFNNGKKLLIGTGKAAEMDSVLSAIGQIKE